MFLWLFLEYLSVNGSEELFCFHNMSSCEQGRMIRFEISIIVYTAGTEKKKKVLNFSKTEGN